MNKRHIILGAWLIVMSSSILFLVTKIDIISDITQFLPSKKIANHHYSLLLDELSKGSSGRLLFVRLKAESPEQTSRLSKLLRIRLLENKQFDMVFNGQAEYDISNYQKIFNHRYLLSPYVTENSFSDRVIKNAFTERLLEIRSGMGMTLKQTIATDPVNSFLIYLRSINKWDTPKIRDGVWFAADDKSALLLIKLKISGLDLDGQQLAISIIQNSVYELANSQVIELDITGPGTFAVATRNEIQHTLTVLGAIASALILLILFYAYRSYKLLFLVGVPLLSAILLSVTLTSIVFGSIHGITLAFGIALLGVCLDYPIHLFSHISDKKHPQDTILDIWPTIRLGVITTSLGYLVLLWSGFNGLNQLAIFSVTGLVVASALTRWLLPDWVSVKPGPDVNLNWLLNILASSWRPRVAILIVIVIGLFTSYVLFTYGDSVWESDVSSLSPLPEKTRLLDHEIRNQIGAPEHNHVFILTDQDPEVLLQKTEKITHALRELVELDIVKGVISPTDVLPSQSLQNKRRAILPERDHLENAIKRATEDMPFNLGLFNNFIDDVENSRNLTPLGLDDIQGTPLASMLASEFFYRNEVWVSIVRVKGLSDTSSLLNWLKANPEFSDYYINLRQSVSEIVSTYKLNAVTWLVVAVIAMTILMWIIMRSFMTTARLMAAPLLAVIISLSLQVVFDVRLNIFHILSLPLIVGIGIDYSLFFNRNEEDEMQYRKTLHGVLISAISTLVAFGVLILTDLPVLVSIGQTVALGVLACFIMAFFMAKPKIYNIKQINNKNK